MKRKINVFLIFGVASVMAVLVYLFTMGHRETYTTYSTIYTGIATNAQFDNLINIIKSRETLEKTAIRLMAQHLILTEPDPGYCLPETWRKLMSEVPVEIKRMVEISYSKPPDNPKKDTVLPRVKTKYYTIKAGDSPFGVCKKFGLTLDELNRLNSPMPPFNGGQRLIVGTLSEPNWVDTVLTKEVPVEIADIVSDENLLRYERLVKAMTDFKDANQENYLFKTLQSSNPYYGVQKISEVRVTRIQSSDLLKLSFDSNDPAVCMQTLKILTDVFRSQYQNLVQSDIQIIDNPVYPVKPNASRRMITVIAAIMAGLVITAFLIILLEFLDTSIKFPGRLAELSGLKLIGAFPWIPAKPDNRINYPLISSRAIDLITQRIRLEDLRQKNRGEQPFILFFISTRENEGKTYLATRVVEKLRASGSKVLYIKPLETNSTDEVKLQFNSFDQPLQAWDYEYAVPDNFISIRNINELLRNYTFLTKGYHYLVIELPALLVQEYPATMTQSGHLAIMVARATRAWNKADDEVVKLFQSSIDHPVLALLNGCQVDQLKSVIGEIPKRSRLSFG
ncbi:MAG: hypothetical protein WC865_09915 [Bacteroidales bacterium]